MISQAMTPAQFAACQQQIAAQYGVHLAGDGGAATLAGVTASCRFDGQTLTVEILKKPFLLSRSLAEDFVRKWLGTFAS